MAWITQEGERIAGALLSPGSLLSIWSLLAALMIASAAALARRRGRGVAVRALIRAVLPHRWWRSASGRTDIAFTLFSVLFSGTLFAGTIASHLAIADATGGMFATTHALVPRGFGVALTTVALWLAYEAAYFVQHYACHKLPFLWQFHRVHHSAESLSPLTVFRVHPVDSILFYNAVALFTGVAAGLMRQVTGPGLAPLMVGGSNMMVVAGLFTIKHLQHSHSWIGWRGAWAKLVISPAAHQLHHSSAPEHHDRNFGATLGLFDWLAGTLTEPARARPRLTFGVEGLRDPHGIYGTTLAPVVDAGAMLVPAVQPSLATGG